MELDDLEECHQKYQPGLPQHYRSQQKQKTRYLQQ